jgi:hypothetical protein
MALEGQRLACRPDGLTHLTWLKDDGTLSFWNMAADNIILTFFTFGPYVTTAAATGG